MNVYKAIAESKRSSRSTSPSTSGRVSICGKRVVFIFDECHRSQFREAPHPVPLFKEAKEALDAHIPAV